MSAQKSDLSNGIYGYDFVVATTQASINATMKAFLASASEPEAKICYVADAKGNPTAIDYADLVAKAHGSDPFSVPDGADPATDKDLQNLLSARFMVGFMARIGLPPGYAPTDIPDIVTLGANTASVTFRLMCSEFVVVQLTPASGYASASWMNVSQPPGDAWLFTSKVDLRMFATGQNAYNNLPPDVRKQIANLGPNAFSVQQLLFDLDNAGLETIPTMSGVQPGTTLYTVLQTDFLGAYFAAMQAQGSPVLGCTVSVPAAQGPDSTLRLSNVNMEVDPFLDSGGAPVPNPTPDQQNLATLSYLCQADGNPLHVPTQFSWNWLDELGGSDGVLSVNRHTFANYFQQQLMPYVSRVCYKSWVRVWLSDADTKVNYAWSLTGNQTPTVTTPTSGSTVVRFHYNSYYEDDAGLNGDMGHMTLVPSLDVSVDFTGNTIVVTQHLVVYLYLKYLATPADGNVIDKTITDTYTLAVDQAGRLTTTPPASVTVDNSDTPSANGFLNFFADVEKIVHDVHNWIAPFVATHFTDLPISAVQNFVFPGGNTFLCKNVQFSDFQDLTVDITYADPTQFHLSTLAHAADSRATMPVRDEVTS